MTTAMMTTTTTTLQIPSIKIVRPLAEGDLRY
jgi:hypothetical protein